jgi:hypothetical protein
VHTRWYAAHPPVEHAASGKVSPAISKAERRPRRTALLILVATGWFTHDAVTFQFAGLYMTTLVLNKSRWGQRQNSRYHQHGIDKPLAGVSFLQELRSEICADEHREFARRTT